MTYKVYLDQNVLTELRKSKILKNDFEFVKLAQTLIRPEFTIVYSDYTLTEIDKINNPTLIDEHIEVLDYLKAIYWNKRFIRNSLNSKEAYEALKKSKDFDFSKNINNKYNNFIKSINGIRNGGNIKEKFDDFIKGLIEPPFEFASRKVPLVKKPISFMHSKIERFVLKRLDFWDADIINYMPRFIPKIRNIINGIPYENIKNIDPENALYEIKKRLTDYDPNFANIFNYNSDDIEIKIEFFFFILNWVGYFPDKFQNDTNKKGFHEASMLDAKHAGIAWHLDYIVSDDTRFRKKCEACYSFVGAKAKVLSVIEFNQMNFNFQSGQ